MKGKIELKTVPEISAVYFALLQCGYGFYSVGRSRERAERVEGFIGGWKAPEFFEAVRQDTCPVYPWWPRAAILETAVFYLSPDRRGFERFETFRNGVMGAGNLSDNERDERLWSWIPGFPEALAQVTESDRFGIYLEWEREETAGYMSGRQAELSKLERCVERCAEKYSSPVKTLSIVLSPIKCAYSADFHLFGDSFVFSSGSFCAESVLHEFLHHAVRPAVAEKRELVMGRKAVYPEMDGSYQAAGELNAFEEFAVRRLAEDVSSGSYPEDLGEYLEKLFRSVI